MIAGGTGWHVMSDATVRAEGLLLGRKTYEIFAARWPHADETEPAVAAMNRMPKYVASRTIRSGDWNNTTVLGTNPAAEIAELRARQGGDLVVFGSGLLVPTLIEHDLVDEYRLLVFPLVIGRGKRLFPTAARRPTSASSAGGLPGTPRIEGAGLVASACGWVLRKPS